MKTKDVPTNINWYLNRVRRTPLLTPKQEKQLARRIREHSDPVARQQMIQANLLLVVKIASEFKSSHLSQVDLIAEGNLGLMRAVEGFDPDQNVRFCTYASWWIRQAIKLALMNSEKTVHIPVYLSKLLGKWRKTRAGLTVELGREPTENEIAHAMGVSDKKAQIIQQGLCATQNPTQQDAENAPALADLVCDVDEHSPDQKLLVESDRPMVEAVLNDLDMRSRQIVRMRFGFDTEENQPMTYREIGEKLGLTRERIRQLEKKALAKIRLALEAKYL